MIELLVQVDPGADLQSAMAALVKVTETVEIVRWIEFPASVLLFLLVPGDQLPPNRWSLGRHRRPYGGCGDETL